jgi:hypothetical protein
LSAAYCFDRDATVPATVSIVRPLTSPAARSRRVGGRQRMYELIPLVEVAAIEQALRAKVHTIFLLIYLFTKRKIGFRTAD